MKQSKTFPPFRRSGALLALACLFAASAFAAAPDPAERMAMFRERERLLDLFRDQGAEAAPELESALDDATGLIRRTAAHLLARIGEPALAGIEKALRHEDFRVRRIAMQGLASMEKLHDYRTQVEADSHPSIVREAEVLLAEATLTVAQETPLPRDGWRFRLDPDDIGRDEGWHQPDYDDGDWRPDTPIETPWGTFLPEPYVGPAWYRRTVPVPEAPEDWTAARLEFHGVDEEAWVWVNGAYAGEHAIGPAGWSRTFHLDITEHVKPGQDNFIAIRAENSRGDGGVWRPVFIQFLKE